MDFGGTPQCGFYMTYLAIVSEMWDIDEKCTGYQTELHSGMVNLKKVNQLSALVQETRREQEERGAEIIHCYWVMGR